MTDFYRSAILLLVLLNPFALSIYLVEILRNHSSKVVGRIVFRACLISWSVFAIFAIAGDRIFSDVLQVRFAAFQVFGGILFIMIALRFMLSGKQTMFSLRGEPERIAGAVAMPFMIGPGTVSAATLAGSKLPVYQAVLALGASLLATGLLLMVAKVTLDHVRERNVRLVERYTEIAGRISAVVVGTVAVEMLFQGIDAYLASRL